MVFFQCPCTLIKKENPSFLIYKEMQMGSGATSYMRKGLLIYEEIRKYFTIYEKAVSHIWLCTRSLWISLYMRKIYFLFYQCSWRPSVLTCVSTQPNNLKIYIYSIVLLHLDQHFIGRKSYRSGRERTLEISGRGRNAGSVIYPMCCVLTNKAPGLCNKLSLLPSESRTRARGEGDTHTPLNWPQTLEGGGLSARDCLRDSQTICSF
jgi:hypothetical protein